MWQNKKRISVVEKNSFITFNQVKDTRLKVYTKVQTTGYTHHQGGQIGLYQKTSQRALFSQTNQVYLHQNEGRSKKSSWSEAHHITHVSSFYQLCETAKVKSFLSPKTHSCLHHLVIGLPQFSVFGWRTLRSPSLAVCPKYCCTFFNKFLGCLSSK